VGILIWIGSGVIAWVAARAIPRGRRGLATELLIACPVALMAGAAATALDFGGWRELDWRAASFAFLLAFAAVGAWRALAPQHSGSRTSAQRS
jgi:hypothetical protein